MKLNKHEKYHFIMDGYQPPHGLISFAWDGYIRKGNVTEDGIQILEIDLSGAFERIEKNTHE
jgi:hypothetical protein